MTEPDPATRVRRSVTVDAAPERAFEVFTADIDRWWPRTGYGIGASPFREAVLERHEGGRWFERGEDGTECTWGSVLVWDPPHRLVLAWQVSADWAYDPALVTEVEARFTPEPDGRTRVDLEHRHLDRYGTHAAGMLAAYDSPNGWQGLLDAYTAAVHSEMFVFMVLHYPAPENVRRLARSMAGMRSALQSQAGCLGVDPPLLSADGQCLVGYSRWESREAFLATGITLGPADETPEGELRPRQRYLLTAAGSEAAATVTGSSP